MHGSTVICVLNTDFMRITVPSMDTDYVIPVLHGQPVSL